MEKLLQEETDNVYQAGAMIYYEEAVKNMALRLPDDYGQWADVFSQEEIQALPQQSHFDRKIELLPNTTCSFGSLYPCATFKLKAMDIC